MSTGDNVSQLIKLHEDCGQSPWLDNITRGWIASGEMRRWIDRGVRGITSNPTIFQKAMASADYDDARRPPLPDRSRPTGRCGKPGHS